MEIFWRVWLMFVHGWIIKMNRVCTQQQFLVSWKHVQNLRIHTPDSIIGASKNGSIQKVLIVFVSMLNSRINFIYQRIDRIILTDHVRWDGDCWSVVVKMSACTDVQKPISKLLHIWSLFETHILMQIMDVDMLPKRASSKGCSHNLLS